MNQAPSSESEINILTSFKKLTAENSRQRMNFHCNEACLALDEISTVLRHRDSAHVCHSFYILPLSETSSTYKTNPK